MRRIASNLVWSVEAGLKKNPRLTFSDEGCLLDLDFLDDPDTSPLTEFYSGLVVVDFPQAWQTAFEKLRRERSQSLLELLPQIIDPEEGILVLLSGLDYERMCLTERSEIRPL